MAVLSTRLLTDNVAILRPAAGDVDRYGNPTAIWLEPETVPARMEQVAGGSSGETHDVDGNPITHRRRVFLQPDVALSARDRIVDVYGRTWQVDGPPIVHAKPSGPHHIEARLVWVED